MSANRCDRCGNLHAYCPCRTKPDDAPPRVVPPTPYEKALTSIRSDRGYMGGPDDDYEPEAIDWIIEALGPWDDGLWLCARGCGLTAEGECDYGGWHGATGHESRAIDVEFAQPAPPTPSPSEKP